MFRPAFPKLPKGGTTNAAVLNQRSGEGSSNDGFPARFGRSLAPKPSVERPVLLLSTSGRRATVKGRPLCRVTIPCSSMSLRMDDNAPRELSQRRSCPKGNSHAKLVEKRRRTSKLDSPYSACGFRLSWGKFGSPVLAKNPEASS